MAVRLLYCVMFTKSFVKHFDKEANREIHHP